MCVAVPIGYSTIAVPCACVCVICVRVMMTVLLDREPSICGVRAHVYNASLLKQSVTRVDTTWLIWVCLYHSL